MPLVEPSRFYRELKPMRDVHLVDKYAPDADHHALHLDAVDRSSAGWGFPVAPCAREWPPKAKAPGQRRVWR